MCSVLVIHFLFVFFLFCLHVSLGGGVCACGIFFCKVLFCMQCSMLTLITAALFACGVTNTGFSVSINAPCHCAALLAPRTCTSKLLLTT